MIAEKEKQDELSNNENSSEKKHFVLEEIEIILEEDENEIFTNGFQDFMNQSKGDMKRIIGCGG